MREAYQYQNLGYLVAGHIAERISGQRWEDFTTERLLRPLGFTHFELSIETLAAAPDHAHPHIMQGDERQRAMLTPIRALPAGGLNACVSDLAKWMRVLIDEGAVDGKPLLSAEIVRQMMTPRVHVGRSVFKEVGEFHYGLGLSLEHYRGERKVSHTGSWVGWGNAMTLLPERRVGVAVLTNRAPSAVTELLTYAALDQLCGHEPIDWFDRLRSMRRQALAQQKVDQQARGELRRTGTAPSHPLGDYAGEYEHPAYGRIGITKENNALAWPWRGMSGQLEHRHYGRRACRLALRHVDPLRLDQLRQVLGRDPDGGIGCAGRRQDFVELPQRDIREDLQRMGQAERAYPANRMAGPRQHVVGIQHLGLAAKLVLVLAVVDPGISAHHQQDHFVL